MSTDDAVLFNITSVTPRKKGAQRTQFRCGCCYYETGFFTEFRLCHIHHNAHVMFADIISYAA